MTIVAQISSDTFAEAEGVAVHTGSPIIALCRELVAAGHGSTTALEAYRGDVLCLYVRSIGEAAGLQVSGHGAGFKQASDGGSASPIRLTALSSQEV